MKYPLKTTTYRVTFYLTFGAYFDKLVKELRIIN